jgi:hypothetical protein
MFGPTLFGLPPGQHFPGPEGHLIRLGSLELHTALLFDLGVALLIPGFVIALLGLAAQGAGEVEP